jgi:hypothetical protein
VRLIHGGGLLDDWDGARLIVVSDDFKRINEMGGHQAGDTILAEVLDREVVGHRMLARRDGPGPSPSLPGEFFAVSREAGMLRWSICTALGPACPPPTGSRPWVACT